MNKLSSIIMIILLCSVASASYIVYPQCTGSMDWECGDMLRIEVQKGEPQIDEIYLFWENDHYIVHRLISKIYYTYGGEFDRVEYRFKGDNNKNTEIVQPKDIRFHVVEVIHR